MKRFLGFGVASLLLCSCQEESTSLVSGVPERPVAARIVRAASVDTSIWFRTDTVEVVVLTSDNIQLLKKKLPFANGSLNFGTVSVSGDKGVTITASGYDYGAQIWTGSAVLPPSSAAQTALLTVDSSKALSSTSGSVAIGTLATSIGAWTKSGADSVYDQPFRAFLPSTTPGALVHYTRDGSIPNQYSPVVGDTGVLIDSSCTLKAVAMKYGWTSSSIQTQSFILQAKSVSIASLSAAAWTTNTYDQPVTVKLTSPTPNAEIHYTLDSSDPTRNSQTYDAAAGILIDSSRTLKAVVYNGKSQASATILMQSFVLQARPATVASLSATAWTTNTYDQPVTVKLTSPTANAEIHYTLDGSAPTRSSLTYDATAGILIDSSRTLKAVVYNGKCLASPTVLTQSFVLQARPATVASLSVTAWTTNTYDQPVTVKLTSATANAEIHYTLDGSAPTRSSLTYDATAGILIDSSRTLKAVVYHGKDAPSTVLTQSFVLQVRPVTIIANENAGWRLFKIGLACPTAGVVIHYTTDGSVPTSSSATYSDSLTFSGTDSLSYQAIAVDTLHPKVATSVVSSQRFGWAVPWTKDITYGTLTDNRDGQSYRTVTIGTQTWMAENLNYKTDSSRCYDNDPSNCRKYGRLYQWSSAMGLAASYNSTTWGGSDVKYQGICPTGWHVPSDAEWTTLTTYIGGQSNAGTKLRANSSLWSTNTGTDAYGFRVLPAGSRYYDGSFYSFAALGYCTEFWSASASENDASNAWYLYFYYGEASVSNYTGSKIKWSSLRCLED